MSESAYKYSKVEMEFVVNNIDEFVIPENQEACKLLWSKNIFTIMTNNYENEFGDHDFSWIALSDLSEENQRVFDDLLNASDPRVGMFRMKKIIKIPITTQKGVNTFAEFKKIIDLFEYQDVQKDGYYTIEQFMIENTDCVKRELNPEHLKAIKPNLADFHGDFVAYSKAYEEYISYETAPSEIVTFDETKMTKSFQEYVDESRYAGLFDPDLNRVYRNQMYYDAHMKYKREFGQQKSNRM